MVSRSYGNLNELWNEINDDISMYERGVQML